MNWPIGANSKAWPSASCFAFSLSELLLCLKYCISVRVFPSYYCWSASRAPVPECDKSSYAVWRPALIQNLMVTTGQQALFEGLLESPFGSTDRVKCKESAELQMPFTEESVSDKRTRWVIRKLSSGRNHFLLFAFWRTLIATCFRWGLYSVRVNVFMETFFLIFF